MSRASPYIGLEARSFWKSGVVDRHPLAPGDIYCRKFPIGREERIATAGSCFAQHIARHLLARGFSVLDAEPAPAGISTELAREFGFGLYSARYGNLYTARQLRQLLEEALGRFSPADAVWQRQDGRCFDALRPGVEPNGLSSFDEVNAHRQAHLAAVRELLGSTDIFIFTLGLTEAWADAESGTVYATAPGTIAGTYDPARHVFRNFTHAEILADMLAVRALLQEHNPAIRLLLTVSPVPLTATASDQHVLVATTYSKSVLRGVAGELAASHADIDYFPSYEIICGIPARGMFYESNLRSVADAGVEVVMGCFFAAHDADGQAASEAEPPAAEPREARAKARRRQQGGGRRSRADVQCEDVLLEAFAK